MNIYTSLRLGKKNIHEIDLIYIGSSNCKFSNSKRLFRSVDAAKSIIYEKAIQYNIGFTAIGIAADIDPAKGIKHLKKFGYFDEIISGNGWSNNGILKYVGKEGVEASTPQIIIIFRTYPQNIKTNIVSEKRVLYVSGERKILSWYEEGAALPKKFIQQIQQYNENSF